jgi:4-amino-4-deoxy-L-arabinose transferase-like glycosyltransferase
MENTAALDPRSARPAAWLDRPIFWRVTPAAMILAALMLLSAFVFFSNLEAIGDANTYYTAAVEAMLDSWQNFFFVAAEPGGSVTVDKPPLGLWIETAFAAVLGVSGFSVSLPNIFAGIFSIPLMYVLIRRHLGTGPGLLAAAVMTVIPVVYATGRNNTMDSLLTFFLLLAAWAFIEAAERGSLALLLLGSLVVGLGFNIKMMQVFLPLPAFFALYFFVSKHGWRRKLLHLALAAVLLAAVSLSWALAVDAVPADQRPYIGSSTDNTVMELIVGHNGLNRLFGGQSGQGTGPAQPAGPQTDGQPLDGTIPQDGQFPAQPADAAPGGQGGGMFNQEIGSPGLFRFFQSELANEASWLLPFALISLVLAVGSARIRLPLESPAHKALLLWGGWLVICLVFFSVAAFFHAYYLVMLAPALAGMIALGWYYLRQLAERKPALASGLLIFAAGLTLAVQVWLAGQYQVGGAFIWLAPLMLLAGVVISMVAILDRPISGLAVSLVFASQLLIPFSWSFLTVAADQPNVNLPAAYAGDLDTRADRPQPQDDSVNRQQALLDFLVAEDDGGRYLVAVPSSQQGSPLVLATGRGVLYLGGFNGRDPVVDADDLAALVSAGDLEFILMTGSDQREIRQWAAQTCTVIRQFSSQPIRAGDQPQTAQPGADGPPDDGGPNQNQPVTLFRCGQ